MVEYLKEYKKLLELKEINEQKLEKNKILIDENLQKWNETAEQEVTIQLELQNINREYSDMYQEKNKKINNKINMTIIIINLIIVLAVAILTHPFFLLPTAYILTLTDGTLKAISILILDKTKFIEKRLTKDDRIIKLLEIKNEKETKLPEINNMFLKLSENIKKYRSESKQLQEKKNWINESINELMRNYAQPIFEEQLKNHQEELESNQEHIDAKDNQQPKTKTKKQ